MATKASIGGHPIHPMLVTLPIGLWVTSFAFDIWFYFNRNPSWLLVSKSMMAAEGKNPIHSMRNPPVVFFPTSCIAEDKEVMKGVREFFSPPTLSPARQKKKKSSVR